ncbi:MAG: oxygen-independent coproporphyrinogen III oxidase [Pseudomonadota bacterium]
MATSTRLALQYGDQKVPRYTSYPTAPHFHAVSAPTYRNWLKGLTADARLSLYVHVPFCKELCWYCGCATTVTQKTTRLRAYVDLLLREIDLLADAVPAGPEVCHLHFGGGTPSAVGPAGVEEILAKLRASFPFEDGAELAMELDPRTVDDELIAALARGGITRASLGVQSLDERVQKAINRVQPFAVTAQVATSLRAQGIRGLNLDLLYGLPYQSEASCRDDAKRVLALEPDRLSVFGYAHVPQMRRHQLLLPENELPDGLERAAQFEAIADALDEAGYVRIGLDHFARPDDSMAVAVADGSLHRNFQGYTTDPADALLGLGTTAIGSLPDGYAQNHAHMTDYRKAVMAGELPVSRGRPIDSDDRARRRIIERLMCNGTVDLAVVADEIGVDVGTLAPDAARLQPLVADGVVETDGRHYRVDPEHWSLLRLAAAAFDRYLDRGADRHSRAV